jgi:ClpX C4-type zinc finger
MIAFGRKKSLSCSFCRRSHKEVARLLGGPKTYICDDCITACNRILEATPAGFKGWDNMSVEALLGSLKTTNATVDATRSVLQQQIGELRGRQVSWDTIGSALGISRQAAWERFS